MKTVQAKNVQAFQLRLPKDEYQALRILSFVGDTSINNLVLRAVREFLRAREGLKEFEEFLEAAGQEFREIVKRLPSSL